MWPSILNSPDAPGLPSIARLFPLILAACLPLQAQNPPAIPEPDSIAQPQPLETAPSDLNLDPGQALAQSIRTSIPRESGVFKGHLKIRRPKQPIRIVPLTFEVQPGESSWKVIYQTEPVNHEQGHRWTILHTPGQTNQYFHATKLPEDLQWSEARPVPLDRVASPLAGSDFWLLDLGLEFLHWPGQRLVKTQMRKGRWCKVLESTTPSPASNGYARVVTWLDKIEGAPLLAEAYDLHDKLLKEFSIGSLKKVDGQWHLEDMKIDNIQSRSRTWIEYDLKQNAGSKIQVPGSKIQDRK